MNEEKKRRKRKGKKRKKRTKPDAEPKIKQPIVGVKRKLSERDEPVTEQEKQAKTVKTNENEPGKKKEDEPGKKKRKTTNIVEVGKTRKPDQSTLEEEEKEKENEEGYVDAIDDDDDEGEDEDEDDDDLMIIDDEEDEEGDIQFEDSSVPTPTPVLKMLPNFDTIISGGRNQANLLAKFSDTIKRKRDADGSGGDDEEEQYEDPKHKQQFISYQRRTEYKKDYDVHNVVALIVSSTTSGELGYTTNYPKKYMTCQIIDILPAIDNVVKSKKKNVGILKNGTALELPFMRLSRSSSYRLSEDELNMKNPATDKCVLDVASRIVLENGSMVNCSISESSSLPADGAFVVLNGMYYSEQTESTEVPKGFSVKVKHIVPIIRSTVYNENIVNALERTSANLIKQYMLDRRFDPITDEESKTQEKERLEREELKKRGIKKKFVSRRPDIIVSPPSMIRRHGIPSRHVVVVATGKMIADRAKMKMFEAKADFYEAKDMNGTHYRKFLLKIGAYGFKKIKNTNTYESNHLLNLFGVANPYTFSTLMSNVAPKSINNTTPLCPDLVVYFEENIGSKMVSDRKFYEKTTNPYSIISHKFTVETFVKGIIPNMVRWLRDGGIGIPTPPEEAMMITLTRIKKSKPDNVEVAMKTATQTLRKIMSEDESMDKELVVSCPIGDEGVNYLNLLANGFAPKRKDDMINLSEYNGDVAPFFRHVVEGYAEFYTWAAHEKVTTEGLVTTFNKNPSERNIKIDGVAELKRDEMRNWIIGKPSKVSRLPPDGWVIQLMLIYKKDCTDGVLF